MTVESCGSEFFIAPYAKVTVKENAALAELEAAKKAAKEELAAYKELTDYREAQQEEIKNILSDSDKAIEVAGDKKAVGKAVKEAKAKLDKVKTDAQLTEEESKPNESKPDESKPSESNKPNKQDNKKPEGVKTGDETPILLLWTLLLSAGATGTAILVKKKK